MQDTSNASTHSTCLENIAGYLQMISIMVRNDGLQARYWALNTNLIPFIVKALHFCREKHDAEVNEIKENSTTVLACLSAQDD